MIIMNPCFPKKNLRILLLALVTMIIVISCKKNEDVPLPVEHKAVTFKFGQDAISFVIDQDSQIVKNMPRTTDVTQLTATVELPTGYKISPEPGTAKDYTSPVTYTITNDRGQTYTKKIVVPVYDSLNNPYGVYTAKHLNDIRNGLNKSYVLMNDIELPEMTDANAAEKTGISDYATKGWYSIGSKFVNGGNVVFRGAIDGQNHVIKNFTSSFRGANEMPAGVDAGRSGKSYDGLFGYAARATFKNIGVQLASAGINDVATDGGSYGNVGGLIGNADTCTVTNCFVTGNATISAGQYTGGLIGRTTYSTISKSYSALTPAAGRFGISSGGDAGGLIGYMMYTDVTDSYSSNSIISAGNIGGLVGNINTSTIKSSYATGNVTEIAFNANPGFVPTNVMGGLVGAATSATSSRTIIENCYAVGAVAGANGSYTTFHKATRIGGLIGQVSSAVPVSVTNCYAAGQVSRAVSNTTAPFYIGGLIGNTVNNILVKDGASTNYWDKEKTGQNTLGGGNATTAADNGFTVNGKTSADMKTQASFVNWDFSTVWTISSEKNNGYPILRSNNR